MGLEFSKEQARRISSSGICMVVVISGLAVGMCK